MNYPEYIRELKDKEKYWVAYAREILANPRSSYSECKTAEIGVRMFNSELAEKLNERKGKPPRHK